MRCQSLKTKISYARYVLTATAVVGGVLATSAYAQSSDVQKFGRPPAVVETASGNSEISLAQHLAEIDAKNYGVWWCPHCHTQHSFFGREAFEILPYTECSPDGVNPQPDVCAAAGVIGYPTWEINGELYPGTQSLETLAEISGYTGPQDFLE